jgi:long-chain acyl-CoA synthetase
MQGYYKNKEATDAVFTKDGWFLTGDVGYLDADKYLYLTGRAKNVIVTEGGKNVYPEEIENNFQLYSEVEQILVKGYIIDKREKSEGIEACIYPSKEWFEQEAAKHGGTIQDGDIEARIKHVVDEVNSRMLPYQRISKITILQDALEMTTTKKIKRHVIK